MSLELKNITKRFDDKILLKDFSYKFNDCGLYVIRGESGIGKTTLLRMIAGLDNDYSGIIEGAGIGKVGFAFQEYRLFPQLSALENVVFSFSDRKDKAVLEKSKRILTKLGFTKEDMNLIPRELSGGMKQRVSLARAFISDYPIILLDEPTKELDDKNVATVRDIIKDLSHTKLIIIVSHSDDDITALSATEILINRPE